MPGRPDSPSSSRPSLLLSWNTTPLIVAQPLPLPLLPEPELPVPLPEELLPDPELLEPLPEELLPEPEPLPLDPEPLPLPDSIDIVLTFDAALFALGAGGMPKPCPVVGEPPPTPQPFSLSLVGLPLPKPLLAGGATLLDEVVGAALPMPRRCSHWYWT